MAKKRFFAVLFTLLPLLAAFGSNFSLGAGAGGLAGGLFTRYSLEASGTLGGPVDVKVNQEIDQFNYGGFFFMEIPWLEFSLSLQGGNNKYRELMAAVSGEESIFGRNEAGTGRELMCGLSLLGKYPFRLNGRLTVFPLAGLEYQFALWEYRKQNGFRGYDRTDGIRETNAKGRAYTLSMWNSLFVDIGGGLDYALSPRLFLRTELLCGFRLQTFYEVDGLEKVKTLVKARDPKLGGLTSGPVLKISLGCRLY
jgi:opacity protein-like surface antigen